ncbi:MAG: glycosyltransferase family 4 protein [Actinomycetota bacterium]
MEPIRVAFDAGPLHGARTGIGNAVQAMADALGSRTDVMLDPYVVSFRARPQPGVRRLPLPAGMALRAWALGRRPSADRWLPGAGVVHGTNYVVPPTRIPSVVSVYDLWSLRNTGLAHPAVRLAGRALRESVRRGAVVHASSSATADAASDMFPSATVTTVLLGALPVPPPSAANPLPALGGRPYVLAVGTLERRKGLADLVRAFGRLHERELALVIAGAPGDDSDTIRSAIDDLGPRRAGNVLLTGWVDDAARSWLLRHAAALAYPSLDEGFGFPLLDAMQVGTPVVATRAGSIPEVAGEAALLVEVGDLDALADAIATAVSDDTVRSRLVAAGDQQWRRFDWETCARGLADLYRRIVLDTAGTPR